MGSLGDKVIPLPGSTYVTPPAVKPFMCSQGTDHRSGSVGVRKERTLENLYGADVELSPEDLADIARVMEENPLRGDRGYGDAIDLKLWG